MAVKLYQLFHMLLGTLDYFFLRCKRQIGKTLRMAYKSQTANPIKISSV